MNTDVLIIGSGIAGLTYALKLAEQRADLDIVIATKREAFDSNTIRAQGGIAAVTDLLNDSIEKHIDDTLKSGKGFSDHEITRMVITNAPERIQELLDWGVSLDRSPDGSLDLHLEGGHSENRIVHNKDCTGLEIETVLLERIKTHPNIVILPHIFAVDIIRESDKDKHEVQCRGAMLLDEQSGVVLPLMAGMTVLSTGGSGQVYQRTSNPDVATGDGVAMAFRAGAKVSNMQYVQFHPTAFYTGPDEPCFLISEALRGFGAWLVDRNEERFMFRYDNRGELATRDIISQAIETELANSGDSNVFLDCRHLDHSSFRTQFPTIFNYCCMQHIDIRKDLIPVTPAAHYQCGGISVNRDAESGIRYLLAIGECASTGLHGANRLASNSLLEALVFSHNAVSYTTKVIDSIKPVHRKETFISKKLKPMCDTLLISEMKKEIRSQMSKFAGIRRTDSGLHIIRKKLSAHHETIYTLLKKHRYSVDLLELRNINQVALLIVNQALENVARSGAHGV